MKVYIVSWGNVLYNDYNLCAIFSTRENAQTYMDANAGGYDILQDFNDIEEYELDQDIEQFRAQVKKKQEAR